MPVPAHRSTPSTSWWAGALHPHDKSSTHNQLHLTAIHPLSRCRPTPTRTRPSRQKGDVKMEARYVQLHLRRCGVVVHHAARMPPASDGRQAVVVFLEAGLQQYELARRCALKLPGVIGVSFSGHTPTIMFVFGAEPGGRTAPSNGSGAPRPGASQRRDLIRGRRAPGPVRSPESARRRASARQQS